MNDSNNLQLYTYTKSKWTHRSPSVDTNFKANVTGMGFKTRQLSHYSKDSTSDCAWAKNNMYRTSYRDMSSKVCFSETFTLNFLGPCGKKILRCAKLHWIHPWKVRQL